MKGMFLAGETASPKALRWKSINGVEDQKKANTAHAIYQKGMSGRSQGRRGRQGQIIDHRRPCNQGI